MRKSWSRKYYTTIIVNKTMMLQLNLSLFSFFSIKLEFIESFLFWVILITYNIGIYSCIYIYKVSYIHSFFVIFNCNVFSALHAKHFEIWKNILWNWWVDCFIARSIKWCDILGAHSESIFPFMQYFFSLQKTVVFSVSFSLAYRWVNQLRYFW